MLEWSGMVSSATITHAGKNVIPQLGCAWQDSRAKGEVNLTYQKSAVQTCPADEPCLLRSAEPQLTYKSLWNRKIQNGCNKPLKLWNIYIYIYILLKKRTNTHCFCKTVNFFLFFWNSFPLIFSVSKSFSVSLYVTHFLLCVWKLFSLYLSSLGTGGIRLLDLQMDDFFFFKDDF